jgi:pseudouridine-5'-phosphate glycosidase/pseudouridine kinase
MHRSPITYISPNLLELEHIYAALEASMELNPTLRKWWWNVIDDIGLGQEYQSHLTILAGQSISNSSSTGLHSRLSLLTEKGAARMAVQLLPFFQHLIIKCGKAGELLFSNTPVS